MVRGILTLFLVATVSVRSNGDRPNRSPELLLLDRFVGTWTVELEVEMEGEIVRRPRYESHVAWSRDGTFVIANEVHEQREQLTVMRFDTAQRKYRGALFSATEQTPFEAEWNEAKQTFTMEFKEAGDAEATFINRFVSEDEIEIRIQIRANDPKGSATVIGTQTRIRNKPRAIPKSPTIEFRLAEGSPQTDLEKMTLPDGNAIYLHPEPIVTRADFLSLQFFIEEDNIPTFRFHLTPEGGRRLGIATRDNIGKSLAILVNGEVIHAPQIQSMITERAQMSGNFTQAMIDKFAPAKPKETQR